MTDFLFRGELSLLLKWLLRTQKIGQLNKYEALSQLSAPALLTHTLPLHSPGCIWQIQWCPLLVLLGSTVFLLLLGL